MANPAPESIVEAVGISVANKGLIAGGATGLFGWLSQVNWITKLELAFVLAGGVGAVDPVVNHAGAGVVGCDSKRWRLEIVGQLLEVGLAELAVVVRVIAKAGFVPLNACKFRRFRPCAGHDLRGADGAAT
jgi:hypothetical protein